MDIWEEELDTPALHSKFVFNQDDGTPVIPGFRTRDQTNFISEYVTHKEELEIRLLAFQILHSIKKKSDIFPFLKNIM